MIKRVSARIAAVPRLYDLIQAMAGDGAVQDKLVGPLRMLPERPRVVDLGGGTGLAARSARSDAVYVCIDLDGDKLRRFVRRKGTRAVIGDATRCPIRSATVDGVMALKVAHHLDEAQFAEMIREAARILRPGGTLILLDAMRANRLASRLLWKLDRGAHPRTAGAIRDAVAPAFSPVHVEEFSVRFRHRFLLWVGSRIDPV